MRNSMSLLSDQLLLETVTLVTFQATASFFGVLLPVIWHKISKLSIFFQ